MTHFIFDFDGTITKEETLPRIAHHFAIEDKIAEITMQAIQGNVPFVESFIRRVFVLGSFSVDTIASLLEETALHECICSFIKEHAEICSIATGNIEDWVSLVKERVPCTWYCSEGMCKENKIVGIKTILHKEHIVDIYKAQGKRVVVIGDGHNDAEAMRRADIAIACGITHSPARSLLHVADYLAYSEEALCRILYQLL